LVVPKEKGSKINKFYGDEAVKFFKKNIDTLYIDTKMTAAAQVFISFLFLTISGLAAYKAAEMYFRNPTQDTRLLELNNLLKIFKKIRKGKMTEDADEFKEKLKICEDLMGENSQCTDKKL